MIERIVFKPLPALYEIKLQSDSDKFKPAHKTTIVFADILDDSEASREDIVYDAVVKKAQNEDIDDLTYSLRLMEPKETRQYLKPRVRSAMVRVAEDRLMETVPIKQLAKSAIGAVAVMSGFTKDPESSMEQYGR